MQRDPRGAATAEAVPVKEDIISFTGCLRGHSPWAGALFRRDAHGGSRLRAAPAESKRSILLQRNARQDVDLGDKHFDAVDIPDGRINTAFPVYKKSE